MAGAMSVRGELEQNLAGIVGLGKAAEIARQGFTDGSVERMVQA